MMDFEIAAKLAGARFVMLSGGLARMERALAAYMLDHNTGEFGYTEINPPALVNDKPPCSAPGQLPKFGDDLFRTTDGYWLIPTAEVPLTNIIVAELTVSMKSELPQTLHRDDLVFPLRSGSGGQRYPWHDPPTPIHQG